MQLSDGLKSLPSLIGYIGAGIIAVTYFLNQRRTLSSEHWQFPALNLLGSLLVLLSLYYQPNAPSVAIEIFWSSISLYGIQQNLRQRGSTPG